MQRNEESCRTCCYTKSSPGVFLWLKVHEGQGPLHVFVSRGCISGGIASTQQASRRLQRKHGAAQLGPKTRKRCHTVWRWICMFALGYRS